MQFNVNWCIGVLVSWCTGVLCILHSVLFNLYWCTGVRCTVYTVYWCTVYYLLCTGVLVYRCTVFTVYWCTVYCLLCTGVLWQQLFVCTLLTRFLPLLMKLTGSQLFKTFPAFYGTQILSTALEVSATCPTATVRVRGTCLYFVTTPVVSTSPNTLLYEASAYIS